MHFLKLLQFNTFILFIVFQLLPFTGKSQGNEETAAKLFKSKQFEAALPYYSELHTLYPNDSVIDYYLGVCRTEANLYGLDTKSLLLKASGKKVPVDVFFYLGKNYQSLNNFDSAHWYYSKFKEDASRKEIKSSGVDDLIVFCNKQENPFEGFVVQPARATITLPDSTSTIDKDTVNNIDTAITSTDQSVPDSITEKESMPDIPPGLADTLIDFFPSSDIHYLKFFQFRTADGRRYFIYGWNNQQKLDSLNSSTDSLRNVYAGTSLPDVRDQLSKKVLGAEKEMLKLKSESDVCFLNASKPEIKYWEQAPVYEKLHLQDENDSIRTSYLQKNREKLPVEPEPDSLISMSDSLVADTTVNIPEPPPVAGYNTGKIIFKVQIGGYKAELPESAKKLYKKISVLRKIDKYTDERNYTIYTIGELTNIKDAVKLQDQIRQESVKDAFIIAFKDGKRIPLDEALELTK